jgi:hypothetical protein
VPGGAFGRDGPGIHWIVFLPADVCGPDRSGSESMRKILIEQGKQINGIDNFAGDIKKYDN